MRNLKKLNVLQFILLIKTFELNKKFEKSVIDANNFIYKKTNVGLFYDCN